MQPHPATQDPQRIVRPRELFILVGIKRATIERMERRGEFPPRIRLGERAVGWRYGEIQEWIESRRKDARAAAGGEG